MATSVLRSTKHPVLLPHTATGWAAVGGLALAVVLFAARVLLTPALRLPLSYLVVFVVASVSGAVALYSVAIRRERSASVIGTLVVGLAAAAWLLAESLGGSSSNVTTLGEADNGNTVTIAQSGGLMIQLPGNPTTGYSWEVALQDPNVVKPTGSTYKPSTDALGSGGVYTFTFAGSSPGTSVVTLTYQRSWETGVAPLRTYTVTVVVR